MSDHTQGNPDAHAASPASGEVNSIDAGNTVGFEIGQEVGGRFVVREVLGSSEGGTSYLVGEKSGQRKMVLKVLDITVNEETAYNKLREQIKEGSRVRHKNLVQTYGLGRESGAVFVAMEYVEGRTLWSEIRKRRDKGSVLNPKTVFNIIGHLSNALVTVHKTTCHGTLTIGNVYLTTKGKVKVANLVFGRIVAEALHHVGRGLYLESPYVAPEVRDDPGKASPAGDIYSLAMITVELLSSEPLRGVADEARDHAFEVARDFGNNFLELIERATAQAPEDRFASVIEYRDSLKVLIDEMMNPPAPTPEEVEAAALSGEHTPQGAADASTSSELSPSERLRRMTASEEEFQHGDESSAIITSDDDDPFARAFEILGKARDLSDNSIVWTAESKEARYLVSRDGLDYGPYTHPEVVAQLHKDEIDEFSFVLDRQTQERMALGDMDVFKKAVAEYLPIREERRRKAEEQRQQMVETAKTAGKGVVVLGVLAGLAVGGIFMLLWFLRPEPQPLPRDVLMAELGSEFKMLPPPREFDDVAVDKNLLAAIFDENAAVPAAFTKRGPGKRGPGKKGPKGKDGKWEDENVSTLDFEGSGGSNKILTDQEINTTIGRRFGGIRGCMLQELKRNPGFKGVSVRFFIKPSGTTGGVKVIGGGSPAVTGCLTTQFRTMKFPAHGGLNKGVTYPLRIQ